MKNTIISFEFLGDHQLVLKNLKGDTCKIKSENIIDFFSRVSDLNINMSSQGKLLILFAEWVNKEGFEPLTLRGGKNMWRRGEHCDYTKDFETKDNEDLVNEFLNQLSKTWRQNLD